MGLDESSRAVLFERGRWWAEQASCVVNTLALQRICFSLRVMYCFMYVLLVGAARVGSAQRHRRAYPVTAAKGASPQRHRSGGNDGWCRPCAAHIQWRQWMGARSVWCRSNGGATASSSAHGDEVVALELALLGTARLEVR